VSATVAEADFVGSAALVAITEIALGEGGAVGAEYSPLALIVPHAAPAHPWPATPLCTLHVTPVLVVFDTAAKNCSVLGVPVEGATNAYAGETVTATGPDGAAIVTVALPLLDGSAWLVTVSVTGFIAGAEFGAR
jgi:hypothetical protein